MATKKTENSTVDTAALNVWQKLLKIREEFMSAKVPKSGKNLHAEFTYFELVDIVPVVEPIIAKYNCFFHMTFPSGTAVGTFINLDNLDEVIKYEFDAREIAEPAKFRMNETQARGAEITYMRRYLYYLLLDITNADEFDGESGRDDTPAPAQEKPKKPATTEQRNEIKEELTAPEANADELQITALKNALKTLKDLDSSKEEFIQKIALKTEKFTKITKSACEKLILTIGDMISEYSTETEDEAPWN